MGKTEEQDFAGGRSFLVEWCALMGKRSRGYYERMDDERLNEAYQELLVQESEVMKRGDDL